MDVQEFQTLYQEKFGLIYRYVYSNVGNREVADLSMGVTVANVKVLQFRALKRAAALERVVTEQQGNLLPHHREIDELVHRGR